VVALYLCGISHWPDPLSLFYTMYYCTSSECHIQ